MPNIDQSDPYIDSVEIPDEARPNSEFSVTVSVGNNSTILSPQTGTCQSGIFGTNVAWRNPVKLVVDGTVRDEDSLCLDGSSGTKDTTFRISLSEGDHTVTAQVLKVPEMDVWDETGGTVSVSESATDPSIPSASDELKKWLNEIASSLGASTTMVAVGIVLAVVFLGVI